MRFIVIFIAALAWEAALFSRAEDAPAGRLHEQQERVRALAGALVGDVLDVQMRQLEENGLVELPLYRDLQTMRANLETLAAEPMQAISRLLEEAEAAPATVRQQKLDAVRSQAREVVAQLLAERQRLYRRMQVAKLSSQVRELMALQRKTHEATRNLADQPPQSRERQALKVLEEQADVDKFYEQLRASLTDVSAWGGQAAASALDGLRLLRAAQVEQDLVLARRYLQGSNYDNATERQQNVLKALGTLAQRLDEAQGLSGADREAALRLVRELRFRQENLHRQTTPQAIAADSPSLLAQQTALHKDLGRLMGALTKFPQTWPLLEAAKTASFEATAALFENDAVNAAALEARVTTNLAQIEFVLESAAVEGWGKSADQLAAEVARLERVDRELTDAEMRQAAALSTANRDVSAAAEHQEAVQQALLALGKDEGLASVIVARLDQASQSVEKSVQELRDASVATKARRTSVETALSSLKLARSEVEIQLADLQRQYRAVQVGELARAAEALERASSAERVTARHLKASAAQASVAKDLRDLLVAEHADVMAVAERISAGVKRSAPQVAASLEQLQDKLGEVSQGIADVGQEPAALRLPQLIRASGAAEAASRSLAAAAAELRAEQGRSSRDLEHIADTQLEVAMAVREAVEQAGQVIDDALLSVLERLAAARRELHTGLLSQMQAEGNVEKARSLAMLWAIEDLLEQQRLADDLADEWTRGLASDALEPASAEQEVSQRALEQSKTAGAEAAAALQQAASAAADAASQILTGSPAVAASKRTAAREALGKAYTIAKAQAEASAANAAQGSTVDAQPDSTKALAKAQQIARQAAQVMQLGEDPRVAATIEKTVQHVAAAGKGDAAAIQRALEQLETSFTEVAQIPKAALAARASALDKLRDRAAMVDASAAAALDQALRYAKREPSDREIADSVDDWLAKMQQATGNLAAREQQIRQDRDVAQVLAALADEQQSARESIAKAATELEHAATHPEEVDRIAAARELLEAQQRFAAAQVAAGEGAVQISGQQQVANPPIREALEIASRLHRTLESEEKGQAEADQATGAKEAGDKATGEKGQETQDKGQEPGSRKQTAEEKAQSQENKGLGTQMVPASPEVTAKQIAGQEANAAAATAMAAAMQGQGQPGLSQGQTDAEQPGQQEAKGQKGKGGKPGDTASDQPPEDADAEKGPMDSDSRAKAPGGDVVVGPGSVQNESWFSKLPPQIRSAIQGKARSQAPRGYEERLRRYFESVD